MRSHILVLFLFVSFFSFCPAIFAQSVSFDNINQSVYLSSTPSHPRANEETTLTFNTYGINTLGGAFVWYIDGVRDTLFDNKTSITLPAIPFNESIHITATFTGPAGTLSREYIYSPVAIDIITESNTQSPAFYKGRSLPVAGSSLIMSAIFHTKNPQKDTYTYEWRLGTSLPEIRRGQRVTFTTPRFEETIFITVKDSGGKTVMERATTITPTNPSILLYAVSPTHGFIPHAITRSFTPADNTTSFLAQRFSSDNRENNPSWSVSGTPVTPRGTSEYMLTLSDLLTSGNSTVNFSASHGKYSEVPLLGGFTIIAP